MISRPFAATRRVSSIERVPPRKRTATYHELDEVLRLLGVLMKYVGVATNTAFLRSPSPASSGPVLFPDLMPKCGPDASALCGAIGPHCSSKGTCGQGRPA